MSTKTISTDLLLAASIAAYRLNDRQYIKVNVGEQIYDYETRTYVVNPEFKPLNKNLVIQILNKVTLITDEDNSKVEEMKRLVQHTLTLKILKNDTISDFENKMLTIASEAEVTENQLAIAAYIPQYYDTTSARQTVESRLGDCQRDHIGQPADKIQTTLEVVRTNYSQKYSCNFITAITDDNKRVFFAYSGQTPMTVHQKYTIKATVKRHDDDWVTVLGRVKPTPI